MSCFKQDNPGDADCSCGGSYGYGFAGCPCDPEPPSTLYLTIKYLDPFTGLPAFEHLTLRKGVCGWCLGGGVPDAWYSLRVADPSDSFGQVYHAYALDCASNGSYELIRRFWPTNITSPSDTRVAYFSPGLSDETCYPFFVHSSDSTYVISQ